MRENAWKKYDEKEMSEVFAFSEGYRSLFLIAKQKENLSMRQFAWRRSMAIVILIR